MTSAKYTSLQSYLSNLKTKLNATDVPERHKNSVKEYKEWLELEIKRTTLRLETDLVVEPKSK